MPDGVEIGSGMNPNSDADGFEDFDLDGIFDLFHASGRVTALPRPKDGDPFAEENVLLRGGERGRFPAHPRGVAHDLAYEHADLHGAPRRASRAATRPRIIQA